MLPKNQFNSYAGHAWQSPRDNSNRLPKIISTQHMTRDKRLGSAHNDECSQELPADWLFSRHQSLTAPPPCLEKPIMVGWAQSRLSAVFSALYQYRTQHTGAYSHSKALEPNILQMNKTQIWELPTY